MNFDWTNRSGALHKAAMSLTALITASFLAIQPANAGSVNRIQTSGNQITVSFDGLVEEASAFSLVGPNRIALDIKGGKAGHGGYATGLIRSVRQGSV